MEKAEVSIVVPVLNEAETITPLIDDLESLRTRVDIIFVDGGSTDGTRDLIADRAGRLLVGPQGRAVQMNHGAAHARAPVLWFIHADTRIVEGALNALLQVVNGGHAWGRFDVSLSGRRQIYRVIERMMNLRSRLSGIATGDQGIFVTRSAFETVGGFPAIPLMEDIALSKSLKRLQRPACLHRPRLITSSRRWEARGPLRTILLMWRLRLAYWLGASPEHLSRSYR